MTRFEDRLAEADRDAVVRHLRALTAPCYESALLRTAFPDMRISDAPALTLYQNHFVLFHILYRLQKRFRAENRHLFIHFMRIFLTRYPDAGRCRFYDEHAGRFCGAETMADGDYCPFHRRNIGDRELDALSDRYFYLDSRNYYNLDETAAESFLTGTWEILNNYPAYQESFAVLGLPETSDLGLIKKRFRTLAMKHHPDRGAASHDRFNEINRAYRLLRRLIPRFGAS